MGPGPSMVSPRVYEALAKPIVGHLDPFLFEVVEEVRTLLKPVFGTENHYTIAISGTGSSGMETAVANFVEPGDKVAVFCAGFFADRIAEMACRHRGQVVRFEKPWGEPFGDSEARELIAREKPDVVAYVQAETSTGVFQCGKGICAAAREAGALVIADCVTSLGGMPVRVDETGIDIAYSCSQKGLGCPPGMAPITVSPRALEKLNARRTPVPVWYMDLKLLDGYYNGGRKYHHTSSATLWYALRESLAMIADEGIEERWERHRRNHMAFVAGIEAMGLSMLVREGKRLWTLNTPRVPEGVDDLKIRKRLLENRNIEIAGGFGPLAGKVFRIGVMGYSSTPENVFTVLDALEEELAVEGYRARSSGRAAAERALAEDV
jgi:alanine-glyoxylate transaminase / serine-glyoxylate transaminase / serine-pyruvate transaminase